MAEVKRLVPVCKLRGMNRRQSQVGGVLVSNRAATDEELMHLCYYDAIGPAARRNVGHVTRE